jgi:hypothetical protein
MRRQNLEVAKLEADARLQQAEAQRLELANEEIGPLASFDERATWSKQRTKWNHGYLDISRVAGPLIGC